MVISGTVFFFKIDNCIFAWLVDHPFPCCFEPHDHYDLKRGQVQSFYYEN